MAVDPVAILSMLNIPMSIGGVIALLIQVVIISVVIMLLDYVISHEIEVKYSFIIGLGAYFITPLIALGLGFANFFDPLVIGYALPLAVWLILSETFLDADAKSKAIVAVAAFAVYTIINILGIPMMIASAIPF